MSYEFRLVVEKVSVASQAVVKRDTIKIYDIKEPKSILDLGLRHEEQISILAKLQNAYLAEQSILINLRFDICPNCGDKIKKNGFIESKFNAVFSDHQIRIQKHRCHNPECNWQSTPTTSSLFGTTIHPDLGKLQSEQGALYSFRDAQSNLDKLNCQRRSVNNHLQIQHISNYVGAQLSQENLQAPSQEECAAPAAALIAQVDGGHIPTKDKDKRSFEALAAIVYRPEQIQQVDNHHRQITNKTCVVSALNDELATIKTHLLNTASKQGLTSKTKVTALADGAKNCWAVISVLEPHCQTIECILDWFHIGKKFQTVKHALGEAFEEALERAKWSVWHGDAEEAVTKLVIIRDNITEPEKKTKIKGLHEYLQNNLAYLVNYEQRKARGETFTSQVAEAHIDSLINERHKKKRKMQWTREGAHNILQIRAAMVSKEWEKRWQNTVLSALIRKDKERKIA